MMITLALVIAGFSFSGCSRTTVRTDMGAAGSGGGAGAGEGEGVWVDDGSGGYDYKGTGIASMPVKERARRPAPKVYADVSGAKGIGKKAIKDVLFDFDRYSVRKDQRTALKKSAAILKEHGDARIVIEGHCDERGTSEYNIALGERRAGSIKKYLTTLGVSSNRIKVISYGKERPFCKKHNEDCWQKNRRGHFLIKK
ncbi:MAG: peptidoglycan-associated lipoprotein Pal [Thermodesulfobacteriota bacterium]